MRDMQATVREIGNILPEADRRSQTRRGNRPGHLYAVEYVRDHRMDEGTLGAGTTI